jgi:hypothetical protein
MDILTVWLKFIRGSPSATPPALPEPGMVLPVNIIFSDPTGQAARMLIETADGSPPLKVLS